MSMPMQRRIADRGLLGVPQPLGRTYGPTGPAAPRSTWQQPPPGGMVTRRDTVGRAPGSAPGSGPQLGPRPLPPNPNTSNPQTGDMSDYFNKAMASRTRAFERIRQQPPNSSTTSEVGIGDFMNQQLQAQNAERMAQSDMRPQVPPAAPWQNNYGNPGGPIMRGGPLPPMPQRPQYGNPNARPTTRDINNAVMDGPQYGYDDPMPSPQFGGGRPMFNPGMFGNMMGGMFGAMPPMFGGGFGQRPMSPPWMGGGQFGGGFGGQSPYGGGFGGSPFGGGGFRPPMFGGGFGGGFGGLMPQFGGGGQQGGFMPQFGGGFGSPMPNPNANMPPPMGNYSHALDSTGQPVRGR